MKPRNKHFYNSQYLNSWQIFWIITGIIGIIFLGFYFNPQLQAIFYKIIEPIDAKPVISISELMKNPEKIKIQQDKLCAWYRREEIRNPSMVNLTAIESLCDK